MAEWWIKTLPSWTPEAFLQQWFLTSKAQVSHQEEARKGSSPGMDSLSAVEFRNRFTSKMPGDLACPVPLVLC